MSRPVFTPDEVNRTLLPDESFNLLDDFPCLRGHHFGTGAFSRLSPALYGSVEYGGDAKAGALGKSVRTGVKKHALFRRFPR
jgi:hypothetical protein